MALAPSALSLRKPNLLSHNWMDLRWGEGQGGDGGDRRSLGGRVVAMSPKCFIQVSSVVNPRQGARLCKSDR
jgi:hypothetical protein